MFASYRSRRIYGYADLHPDAIAAKKEAITNSQFYSGIAARNCVRLQEELNLEKANHRKTREEIYRYADRIRVLNEKIDLLIETGINK